MTWAGRSGCGGSQLFERVLVSAGRKPDLDGLGLEEAGLAPGPHGVPDCDPATMRCGESAIFPAGDVGADRPVLQGSESRLTGWSSEDVSLVGGSHAAIFRLSFAA